jgi:hypothetical protein
MTTVPAAWNVSSRHQPCSVLRVQQARPPRRSAGALGFTVSIWPQQPVRFRLGALPSGPEGARFRGAGRAASQGGHDIVRGEKWGGASRVGRRTLKQRTSELPDVHGGARGDELLVRVRLRGLQTRRGVSLKPNTNDDTT